LRLYTRRKFVLGGVAAAGVLALGGDALIVEPNHAELVRVEVFLRRLPPAFDGFTIAQLSDFHYDPYVGGFPIRAAVEIVNRVQPDLAVLTGDFVTVSYFVDYLHNERQSALMAEPCAKLLAQMRAKHGLLAVLGNHDVDANAGLVTEALSAHGIPVLRNHAQPIERDGRRLWLCGLDSLEAKPKIELALQETARDEPVILLVHEPDYADRACKYPVDLQLSGHSHGGQVWLPGVGAPWLPPYARKYPRGRYQVGRLILYTNIGIGTIRFPVRFNCTPEVTLFTLRSGEANRSSS